MLEVLFARFDCFPSLIKCVFVLGVICFSIVAISLFFYKPEQPNNKNSQQKESLVQAANRGAGFRASGSSKIVMVDCVSFGNKEGVVAEDNATIKVIGSSSGLNK